MRESLTEVISKSLTSDPTVNVSQVVLDAPRYGWRRAGSCW